MKFRSILSIAALSLFAGCSGYSTPPKYEPYATPHKILYLKGDIDFTETERFWLKEATANLAEQTHGYVSVDIDYSVNYNSIQSIQDSYGFDILMKVDKQTERVKDWDTKHCCLLGLTAHNEDKQNPLFDYITIYLVAERIEEDGAQWGGNRRLFVSIAMHEMLHALGLRDLSEDKATVMSRYTPEIGTPAPVQLGPRDYTEACRVWGCNPRRLANAYQ